MQTDLDEAEVALLLPCVRVEGGEDPYEAFDAGPGRHALRLERRGSGDRGVGDRPLTFRAAWDEMAATDAPEAFFAVSIASEAYIGSRSIGHPARFGGREGTRA